MIKELFSNNVKLNLFLTDFYWGLWSTTLFAYLLAIYGYASIGISLSFVLILIISLVVFSAYYQISIAEQDEIIVDYCRSRNWWKRWSMFMLSYLFIILIVSNPPSI